MPFPCLTPHTLHPPPFTQLRKKVFSVGDMAAKTMNTRLSVNGRLNTTAVILDAIKLRCAMGLRTYEHQVAYRKAELGIVDQVKDYVNNEVKEHADLLNVVLAEKKHKAENRKKDEDDIELDEKKLKVSKEKAGELMKEKEANQELELKNKEGQEKLAASLTLLLILFLFILALALVTVTALFVVHFLFRVLLLPARPVVIAFFPGISFGLEPASFRWRCPQCHRKGGGGAKVGVGGGQGSKHAECPRTN